jgi:hypothetical protein
VPKFAAVRLANEGGTHVHGSISACAVTGRPSAYPYERGISPKPYRGSELGGCARRSTSTEDCAGGLRIDAAEVDTLAQSLEPALAASLAACTIAR